MTQFNWRAMLKGILTMMKRMTNKCLKMENGMAFKMTWSQIRMMKILRTIVLRGGKLKVMTEKRRKRRTRTTMSLKKMILTCLIMRFCNDKDGNVITEEDVGEGLKQIMERHMSRLRRRLDMYPTLAGLGDNDQSEEEAGGEEEAQGEIE